MRVGEILVDRDRLFETCDRIGVSVERLQRAAAVVPGAGVLWRSCDRRIECSECRIGSLEFEQRVAAIVERLDVMRDPRQDRIEIGEGIGVRPSRARAVPRLSRASPCAGLRASTASKQARASSGRSSAFSALPR